MGQTVAGVLSLELNGVGLRIKAHVTYNLGRPIKTELVGADGFHGYSTTYQAARAELTTSDHADLDLEELLGFEGTATLHLANGKLITFQEAFFAGSGDVNTEESEITVKLVAKTAVEVRP